MQTLILVGVFTFGWLAGWLSRMIADSPNEPSSENHVSEDWLKQDLYRRGKQGYEC